MSEVDKSCFPLHIVNVERGSFTLMKNGRAGGAGRGGRAGAPAGAAFTRHLGRAGGILSVKQNDV